MSKLIEFSDVVKEYGTGESKQLAVNHVDFTIEEGEFVVILGQSGAGKSTVLNMLGGMDQATSGEIMINGQQLCGMTDNQMSDFRADNIGFIFRSNDLVGWF